MRYLIVRPHAGLGNRIRALVAARRAAKKLGRQLGVLWSLDGYHCYCPYDKLFGSPNFSVGDEFISREGVELHGIIRGPNFIDPESLANVIAVQEENFFYVGGDEQVMLGQHSPYRMRNPAIRDELQAEFDALSPADSVVQAVNQFVSERFGSVMVGCHARREDNYWSNKFCSDEMFVEKLSFALAHMPQAGIFLATDSASTEAKLRKTFGRRIVTYPVRSLARGASWEAIQDAFIVMLLLSQTDILVRSCSSSFSQCASWFGRVPTLEVGRLEHSW